MALKAGMFGLSVGSSKSIGRPGQAFLRRSRSYSQATVKRLCFAVVRVAVEASKTFAVRLRSSLFRYRLTANSELARTRGIRLFN